MHADGGCAGVVWARTVYQRFGGAHWVFQVQASASRAVPQSILHNSAHIELFSV